MAAAFPGLHDRLIHFISVPVVILAGEVEAGKLDDVVDEPSADEPPALAPTKGVLVELVGEPEL
jgi:hypothetical protein